MKLLRGVLPLASLLLYGCAMHNTSIDVPGFVPQPRSIEYPWMTVAEWWRRHEVNKRIAASEAASTVFYGDSIIEAWAQADAFASLRSRGALALGLGGDTTENLVWRLQHGEAGGLRPHTVVILIGVNDFNHQGDTPEQVAYGCHAVVNEVRSRLQPRRVIVLGVLPSGQFADDPLRARISAANHQLSAAAKAHAYHFHDIGAAFLQADGSISSEIMADFLHPTERGYEIFARQIERLLSAASD